jgi:hypothetical protein
MNLLATILFASPWLLLGLAGTTLPVAAHLLTRRARRKIVFPTIRLLRESRASQSRLYRIRRWLLLALRCLAAAAVAFAFAQPVWLEGSIPPVAPGKGAALVLVLDTSASSAQQAGGIRLIDSMRAEAGRAVDSLQAGRDVVNIVYARCRSEAALPQLTANTAAIRSELDRLAPTAERADLAGAIALAGRMLASHPGQRQLMILSDLQRSNWAEVSLKGPNAELVPEGTVVTVTPIDVGPCENASLSQGRCSPVQPVVGSPVQLAVRVCNYSDRERTIPVEASLDGQSVGKSLLPLKAWEATDVAFPVTFSSAGVHRVLFSTAPDGLACDNQCFLAVQAVRQVSVAVVGDENPNQNDTGTYFTIRALAPAGDAGDAVEVRHLASADLSYTRIADAEAVFVGYVGKLSSDALKALHMYANQGGGVVFFCGEGPVAENLMGLNALAQHGELLPWTPGPPRDLGRSGGFLTINSGQWDSRLLSCFDEASQLALKQIRFNWVWSAGPLRHGAAALLTYEDGTPAMGVQSVGSGKLVVANFSPAMHCSNLGKYGSFVALVQGLTDSLRAGQEARGSPVAGEAFVHLVKSPSAVAPEELAIVAPDGRQEKSTVTGDKAQFLVNFRPPELTGFYRVSHRGATLSIAAVNVDPREGDLRKMDEQTLRDRLAGRGHLLQVKGSQMKGEILNLRGRPLWAWCVLAAMVFIALELGLLGLWKR